MKKIGLYIMGYKGLSCLQAIIDTAQSKLITAVICSRDKAIKNDYYIEIAKLCKKNNILFFDREKKDLPKFDVAVAISWRWMIKISDQIPLIVFHDSLLPKYRGFAPLVNSLVNGEKQIGVTALFASDEYDKGNIIMQSAIDINYPINIEEAINKVSGCYTEIMIKLLDLIVQGNEIKSYPQKEEEASYSLWLNESDYLINWHKSSAEIKRFIDSVGYPYNGAFSTINGKKVRIYAAEEYDDVIIQNRVPGKVIFVKENFPVIVCGKGLLKLMNIENESGEQLIPLKNFRTQFL